jgi:hypothetical protein
MDSGAHATREQRNNRSGAHTTREKRKTINQELISGEKN